MKKMILVTHGMGTLAVVLRLAFALALISAPAAVYAGAAYRQGKSGGGAYVPLSGQSTGGSLATEKKTDQGDRKVMSVNGTDIVVYRDVNDLLRRESNKFANVCSIGEEALFVYSYEDSEGKKWYYAIPPKSQESSSLSVGANFKTKDFSMGYEAKVIGWIHNHPLVDGLSHAWFSNMDVMSTLMSELEFAAVADCQTGQVVKIDVRELENGTRANVWVIDKDNKAKKKEFFVTEDGRELCHDIDRTDGVCSPIANKAALEEFAGTFVQFASLFGRKSFYPDSVSVLKKLAKRFKAEKSTGNGEAISQNVKDTAVSKTATVDMQDIPPRKKVRMNDKVERNKTMQNTAVKKPSTARQRTRKMQGHGTGVKGWCSCDRDYKSVIVGAGEEFAWTEKPVPGYAYVLCLHCGKCRRPSKSDDIVIWDRVKEVQLFQNADSDMTTHDYVKAKMAVQEKLLKIPNGKVVIPGKCSCKEPSPVRGGSAETEIVSVCEACGLRCD